MSGTFHCAHPATVQQKRKGETTKEWGWGSTLHMLCPRHGEPLMFTVPMAMKLWCTLIVTSLIAISQYLHFL